MPEPIREVWVISDDDGDISLDFTESDAKASAKGFDALYAEPHTIARLPILTDEAAAVLAAAVALDDVHEAMAAFNGDYESVECIDLNAQCTEAETAWGNAVRAYKASAPEGATDA